MEPMGGMVQPGEGACHGLEFRRKTSSNIGSRDAVANCHAASMDHAEVLLIGGRAGVGKSTVGWEVSARLRAVAVAHAIIEGDFMGQVHPAPEGDPRRSKIVERNLTAVWANFAQLGYRRLINTNTVSVLPGTTSMFERAMGAGVRIVRVLLTASDATAGERLAGRELGSELEKELKSSA
jgi:predicted kinase